MAPADADRSVYLVKGDDPSLVAQRARELIEQLVGERDPALVVEEHGGAGADDLDVGGIVDACTTPPFLVDRRVVIVRDAGRLTTDDVTRLAPVIADPLPQIHLVLVAGGGTLPPALAKALSGKAGKGEVIDIAVRSAGDRKGWVAERLHAAPVRLDAEAANQLRTHLGEDLSRLDGVLSALAAAYGDGAAIDAARLAPFLGQAGSVPPWELTGAIDEGDVPKALDTLTRLTGAGGLAGPAVVGILQRHFGNMLRLSGADVRNDTEAAEVLGMRPGYPAKRALAQSRRLGSERLAEAITLLAEADVNVKGRTGLPPTLVLEIAVARLARLSRAGGPPPRASSRSGRVAARRR